VEYAEDMKNKLQILYEDNHIIVVIKPINILSQKDNTNDLDMVTLIKDYLKIKYKKPGNVYLGLVHRLDRPTGGIMVFAKTSKAASRLSKQLNEKTTIKKYYAVVNGIMKEKEKTLENYIKKLPNNTSIITNEKEGKSAKLTYKVLEELENLSLLDITLHTGRHHQIRVQLKNIHHSLYGDQRYGIQDNNQLALYAYHLEFTHPTTKERMIFEHRPHYGIFKKFWRNNEK